MKNFTHHFIHHSFFFPQTTSTMDEAEIIIKDKGVSQNFLIIADQQVKGKGRRVNEWLSPSGGLWFSLALFNYALPPTSMLFMGYLLRKTLSSLYPEGDFKIKWPNDVFLNEKKLCGMICNHLSHKSCFIFGIGINTNNQPVQLSGDYSGTSIKHELLLEVNHSHLLSIFLDLLENNLNDFLKFGLTIFLDDFNKYHLLQNKMIRITTGETIVSGICHHINEDGSIVIETQDGCQISVYAGNVTIIS